MHHFVAHRYIELVKLRVQQGDNAIEPPLPVHTLEQLVVHLDQELQAEKNRLKNKAQNNLLR